MRALAAGVMATLLATPMVAQGYRAQLDLRTQAVAFRGLALDSVSVADTVTGPDGGPATVDGFAVRCAPGAAHCTYFRPGPERRGVPVVLSADVAAWGFGIRGLSAHGSARVGLDAGDGDGWAGTDPAVQLLGGYVEYARPRVTARAGRQTMLSRFGATGFDGGLITLRDAARGWEGTAFAGWGLARGVALPVTSPALNPLDDFQPRRRQLVAGFTAAWSGAATDVRLEYQREVDPRSDYFVSERLGLAGTVRPAAGWTVDAGADYDLAAGAWGSAEARLTFATRGGLAAIGARRYRPHFELWTIWGAFSPVPYTAMTWHGSLNIRPRIQLRASGEVFEFADDAADTPLAQAENAGWRGVVGATASLAPAWTIDAGYHHAYGPGAASTGASAAVTYARPRHRITLHGATLDRPLEFRFSESVLHVVGLDAGAELGPRWRITLSAARHIEDRTRPDAAAMDWDQWRFAVRLSTLLGTGDDLGGLPPAVRRMPGDRAGR